MIGLSLVSLILPKRSFSEAENRFLQEVPEFTVDAILSGSFMKDAEDYAADHIAGRDQWVGMQARFEEISGKGENSGAFFADQDTLIKRVDPVSLGSLSQKINVINAFAEKVDVPVYFGLIPSPACVWADRLPEGAAATTMDEETAIHALYQMCDQDRVTCLNLLGMMQAHANEEIYYRTDHHWTSLGAGYGFQALIEAMNQRMVETSAGTSTKNAAMEMINPLDYQPVTVSDSFYGTTWSSSGAHWVKPDHIDTYIQDNGNIEVLSYTDPSLDPVPNRLYHEEKLDVKDKYSYFLGGNQPICTIKTGHEGPKILLVRDSYSDSLAPWLTERFSEITLIDFRYTRTSVSEYIAAHDYDCALILYGFSGFTTDRYMNLLQ
ncbi:MAG: hypothetical protein II627_00230, partial [Lachnospiraceae bacterium]|nr:hypothetical protein [Lachnospiraceae bacterium]